MTRNLFIIEKIIAASLIAWGGLGTYRYGLDILLLFNKIPFYGLFRNYHLLFILFLLTFIAGLLLFLNKKSGWTLALITLFLNSFLFLIPSNKYNTSPLNSGDRSLIIFSISMTLIAFIMFVVLLLKSFKIKYNPTNKTWWTISIIIFVMMLDKTLWFLLT
jgi:hypothetical protein